MLFTSFSKRIPCSSSRGYPSIRKHLVVLALPIMASLSNARTSSCNVKSHIKNHDISQQYGEFVLQCKITHNHGIFQHCKDFLIYYKITHTTMASLSNKENLSQNMKLHAQNHGIFQHCKNFVLHHSWQRFHPTV